MGSLARSDTKKLHDRAGGECSFPGCDTREHLEEAHIFAKSDGGPRANPAIEPARRQTYENFILLCPTHHRKIDHPDEDFTVSRLLMMKHAHEEEIASRSRRMTEFEGSISAEGTDVKSVTGARVRKPTRFRAGTRITAKGTRVDDVTGLEIAGGDLSD